MSNVSRNLTSMSAFRATFQGGSLHVEDPQSKSGAVHVLPSLTSSANAFTGSMTVGGSLAVAGSVGFYGAPAISQYDTEGIVAGFTAGGGTAAKDDSTFTGNKGTKAYTVGDIVNALKTLGLMDT